MFNDFLEGLRGRSVTIHVVHGTRLDGTLLEFDKDNIQISSKANGNGSMLLNRANVVSVQSYIEPLHHGKTEVIRRHR